MRIQKRARICLCISAAILAVRYFQGAPSPGEESVTAATDQERVAYLEGLGWEVDPTPIETLTFSLPQPLSESYATYNELQLEQGFDLEPYAGQICTQYVYKVENHPGDDQVYATLLVYGDEIIGGDIASTAVDGFMHGFASDSAHFGESGIATATPAATASPQATVAPESSAAESAVGSAPESAAAETAQGTEAAGEPLPEAAYPVD